MLERHGGGCLCGAIRFVMTGKPMKTSICYCSQCQRQSGSPMPAFATCRAEQLTITTGEPVSYRSSERATRYFCSRCGSSLFWIEDDSDARDIYLGTFDKPSELPVPRYAIWAAHRVAWIPDLAWIPSYAAAHADDG